MSYAIYDTHGAPQCSIETIICNDWSEVEAYFENAEAAERLALGYAFIKEL